MGQGLKAGHIFFFFDFFLAQLFHPETYLFFLFVHRLEKPWF